MSDKSIISKVSTWLREIGSSIQEEDTQSMAANVILQTLNIKCPAPISSGGTHFVRWSKPPIGWLKLNIDGSFRNNPGDSGGGGVCRDYYGRLIFAFCGHYGIETNMVAEAQAMLDGLSICSNLGLTKVIFESDSNVVINAARDPQAACPWNIWYRMGEIQAKMTNLNIIFAHIFREGNAVADELARMASEGCPERIFRTISDLARSVRGALVLDNSGLGSIRRP